MAHGLPPGKARGFFPIGKGKVSFPRARSQTHTGHGGSGGPGRGPDAPNAPSWGWGGSAERPPDAHPTPSPPRRRLRDLPPCFCPTPPVFTPGFCSVRFRRGRDGGSDVFQENEPSRKWLLPASLCPLIPPEFRDESGGSKQPPGGGTLYSAFCKFTLFKINQIHRPAVAAAMAQPPPSIPSIRTLSMHPPASPQLRAALTLPPPSPPAPQLGVTAGALVTTQSTEANPPLATGRACGPRAMLWLIRRMQAPTAQQKPP